MSLRGPCWRVIVWVLGVQKEMEGGGGELLNSAALIMSYKIDIYLKKMHNAFMKTHILRCAKMNFKLNLTCHLAACDSVILRVLITCLDKEVADIDCSYQA